jgi:hypothetical protein
VIEAAAVADDGIGIALGPQFGVQRAAAVDWLTCHVHVLAPFSIWAMWMNFIGTPMRSAQPCFRAFILRQGMTRMTIKATVWATVLRDVSPVAILHIRQF